MRNIRNIIIWLVMAYLGFVVWQICLARIQVVSNPERALSKFPSYSEALIAQNYVALQQINPEGLSTEYKALINTNTRKILRKAPLNDDALLQAALLSFLETGEYSKPELLVMAKGRNARNRNTLRHLLSHYLRVGAYEQAVDELDLLMRLDPKSAENYNNILDDLYQIQGGKAAINERLKTKRVWSNNFLKRKIRTATSGQILALSVPVKYQIMTDKSNKSSLGLVDDFLSKLVSTGQSEYAYEFWKDTYSEQVENIGSAKNLMFNPLFKDLSVPSPFNWHIYRHATISTEYDMADGLFVSFNDTKPRLIVRQYTKISNGRQLKVTFDARLNYKEQQGDFEWRLICLKNKQKISTLSTFNLINKSDDALIEIPSFEGEGCQLIDVQLWGMPSVYNNRISMTIKQFDMTLMERH